MSFGAVASAGDPLMRGLVGWYRMLGDANDSSGKGNNGTLTGEPTLVGDKFSDPYFSNVVALLSGDGANGSTTITDSSPLLTNWAVGGATTISTAQKKFGSASISCASSYIINSSGSSTNFAFGTGDFTIETWVYANDLSNSPRLFDFRAASTNGNYPYASFSSTGTLIYWQPGGTASAITSAVTVSLSTWTHIAICRASGTTRMFFNGVQTGSDYTDATDYLCGASRPIIGAGAFTAGGSPLNGYLDDIRITKGVARYAANFTPPTAALPQSPSGAYSFNGTSQYVALTQTSGLSLYKDSSSYSVAGWVNGDGTQAGKCIYSDSSSTASSPLNFIYAQAGSISYYQRNSGATIRDSVQLNSASTVFDNTWHHFAVTYDDTTRVIKSYVDGTESSSYTYSGSFTMGATLDRSTFGALVRASVGNFFSGKMFDMRLYNRALSAAEVGTLYRATQRI